MRKYTLNESYFENINTAEKAYWLGFISADGCISKNKQGKYYYLVVGLQKRDRDHLEKLANALGYSGPVHDYSQLTKDGLLNEYSKVSFASFKLVSDLEKLGVTPRKSLTLEPWRGESSLIPHYFRGLIDGDGSVVIDKDGWFRLRFNGTKAVVEDFRIWANNICDTKSNVFVNKNIFGIAISGNVKVGKLISELYGFNQTALTRKLNIAKEILAAE